MSASERLAALDAAVRTELEKNSISHGSVWTRAAYEVMDALPEIVAVVEAAEHVTFYGQPAYQFNEWHGSELLKSLAALEEKLEVVG